MNRADKATLAKRVFGPLALTMCLALGVGFQAAPAFAKDDAPLQAQGITTQAIDYDTSWYYGHEGDASFTLEDVMDLKGLAHLVNTGVEDFQGTTIQLKSTPLARRIIRSRACSTATTRRARISRISG